MLDRECVKDYIISPQLPGEKEVLVKKGSFLLFPLAAIQHDPKYFPNPTKFDPERFSDENKSKIQACSYLPMGIGPRYCIGKAKFNSCHTPFKNLLKLLDLHIWR